MPSYYRPSLALVALVAWALIGASSKVFAQIVTQEGFDDRVVVNELREPTDMAFLPSGRILATEKGGTFRVVSGGLLCPDLAARLAIDVQFDRGLQSVVLHPDFAHFPYAYCLYTHDSRPPTNRISRFRVTDMPGCSGVKLTDETIFADGLPSDAKIHAGGFITFGLDGYLYVGTGDGGGIASISQDLRSLAGKILRY